MRTLNIFAFFCFLSLGLVACTSSPAKSTSIPSITNTLPTATLLASETATHTPTPQPTVPVPDQFTSDILRPEIEPATYIADSCSYLSYRWNPAGSLPGTVVAPIMFHSILEGNAEPGDASAINFVEFEAIVRQAEQLGFETITTEELLAFLQENARIPARSMILILDDRRPGTAEEYFLPANEAHDWTTTLAWIPGADTATRPGYFAGENLWDWIERIYETGYFDVQSHGKDHTYLNENMTEDAVRTEIEGSVSLLEEHFGQTPIAYIWPGGNFTELGIQIAHEAGFELGFTIFSRGPLQFNWIPQAHEAAFGDPLMLLPRFWSSAAIFNLEQTAEIGDAAQQFAEANYAAEAAWFAQNCGGELEPLEKIFK